MQCMWIERMSQARFNWIHRLCHINYLYNNTQMEIGIIRGGRMRERGEWMDEKLKRESKCGNRDFTYHEHDGEGREKIVLDRNNTPTADGTPFLKVRHARLQ